MTTSKPEFEDACAKESVRLTCHAVGVRSFADFVNDMWENRKSSVIGLSLDEARVVASPTWSGWIRRATLWLFRSWTVKLPDNVQPVHQGPRLNWSVEPPSDQDAVKSMDHLLSVNEKFHSQVLSTPGTTGTSTVGSSVSMTVDAPVVTAATKRKPKRSPRPKKCACLASQSCSICAAAKKAFFERIKLPDAELKRLARKYVAKFGVGAVVRSVKQFPHRPDYFEVTFKRPGRRLLSRHSVSIKSKDHMANYSNV